MGDPHPGQVLSDRFLARHPAAAARVFGRLSAEQQAELGRDTSPEAIAPLFALADPVQVARLAEVLETERLVPIVEAMPIDAASVLLRRLARGSRDRLLQVMPPARQHALRSCLSYPVDSAGAVMDPSVLTLAPEFTVADARTSVTRAGPHAHYYLFVVDETRALVGVLSMRELFAAPPDGFVGAVARRDVARIGAHATRETIVAHPAWADVHALPVVDGQGCFLGVLRYETLRRLEEGSGWSSSEAAASLALALGELCWRGAGVLLDEVAAAVRASPGRGRSV